MKARYPFILIGVLCLSVCAGALGLTRPGQLDDAAGMPGMDRMTERGA